VNCRSANDWDMLAIGLLEDEQSERMLAHAHTCAGCREALAAARRDHADRVRVYETFDREHDQLREQLLAALPAELPRSTGMVRLVLGWHRLGDTVMSMNKTATRRAAAVLVPAACIVAALIMLLSPGAQRSAFAAALAHIKQAQTIVCRITLPESLEMHGVKISGAGTLRISEEHGARSDMHVNGMLVAQHYARAGEPLILVQPVTQTWMELDVSELAGLDVTEQSPSAFVEALRELTDHDATELGPQNIDGRVAIGYRIPGAKLGFAPPKQGGEASAYAELWVDEQTRRPARMMLSTPIPTQDAPLKMVYDQFEWDVPLEPRLFEPDIPAHFTKIDARLTRPTEDALLNALQRIRDVSGGRYPTSLDGVSTLAEIHSLLTPAALAKFDELGMAGVTQLGLEIAGGCMYYRKLIKEGHEPEYFGDRVTDADSDAVLVRWRLADGQVRVIYGDLRVETLRGEK